MTFKALRVTLLRLNELGKFRVQILPLLLVLVCYTGQAFSDGFANLQPNQQPGLQTSLQLASKSADSKYKDMESPNKPPDIKDLNQAVSLYTLGLKYLHGKGVKKNNLKALRLFKKSAEQGYPRAEYQLGIMYRDGIGVGRDKQEAVRWFRLAAAWGETDAKKALDKLIKGNNNNSNDDSKRTANGQTAKQLYQRAKAALSGSGGKTDYKKAFELLKKSASLNHKESQFELGILYKNGTGTSKNIEKAKKWLNKAVLNGYGKARLVLRELVVLEEKHLNYKTESGQYNFSADAAYIAAAQKGDVGAQFKLGLMYIEGDEIARNPSKGLEWLRRAAEQEHLDSQLKLGDLLYKGVLLDKDYAESAKWYQKAAKQGHPGAQYILANMYKKGLGLDKDKRKAEKWYREAANQGHVQAKDKIKKL